MVDKGEVWRAMVAGYGVVEEVGRVRICKDRERGRKE